MTTRRTTGRPALVVVTGPPASGKTTVAETIAEQLKLPVISKDALKETLYDQLGSGEELEEKLDRTALALLFRVVAMQLDAGVSVMAESNFDARTDPAPFRRLSDEHGVLVVQVHMNGETERLVAKFARRAAEGRRHPGHGDEPSDADELRTKIEAGLWKPLDLPGELLEAHMDDAEEDVADRVRALLAGD